MVKTVSITQANLIVPSNNVTYNASTDPSVLVEQQVPEYQFKYSFPNGSVKLYDYEAALTSVTMKYSWFNISDRQRNNTFTLHFPDNTGYTSQTVTIQNGTYDRDQLAVYITQYVAIQYGYYLIDGSGNYIYFYEMLWNPTKLRFEWVFYPVPTSLPPGFSEPANKTWTYPSVAKTPYITILSYITSTFGYLIGFNYMYDSTTNYTNRNFPNTIPQLTTTNVLANTTDNLQDISNIFIHMSILYNTLTLPASFLSSIPLDSNVPMSLIVYEPGSYNFIQVKDGQYNDFTIWFTDYNNNPIYLQDFDINVLIALRPRGETS